MKTFEILESQSLEENIERLKEAYNGLPLPAITSEHMKLNPIKGLVYELTNSGGGMYFMISRSSFARELQRLFRQAAEAMEARGK